MAFSSKKKTIVLEELGPIFLSELEPVQSPDVTYVGGESSPWFQIFLPSNSIFKSFTFGGGQSRRSPPILTVAVSLLFVILIETSWLPSFHWKSPRSSWLQM